jgi:hypothetical protein
LIKKRKNSVKNRWERNSKVNPASAEVFVTSVELAQLR